MIKWQWQTSEQQQNVAIPVKIADEIANLSTIKGVCVGNSGFDIELILSHTESTFSFLSRDMNQT